MGNIVLLDELTINQIAAGEVIERPASVVKEMVENSIDAGATNIVVEVKNGGISYIKITDNGKGIRTDDLEIAFERHATSKIRNANDLATVTSMGFRGEALASISAIAKVELISKTKDQELGNKIIVEGGNILKREECACQIGTSITVTNLFYNTPVRYKFLKKDYTETGYIEDVITRIALVNPGIAIRLINAGKTIIHTNGSNELKNVVYSIYGKETAQALLEIDYTFEDYSIKGVVGKPEIARSNRSYQLFFVNKRYVRDKSLSAAIEQAFKGMIPLGKFGFAILNITMNPAKVDVNVHPAKLEVRFEEENKVFQTVFHSIKDSLGKTELIANVENKLKDDIVNKRRESFEERLKILRESKKENNEGVGLFGRKFNSNKQETGNILEDIYKEKNSVSEITNKTVIDNVSNIVNNKNAEFENINEFDGLSSGKNNNTNIDNIINEYRMKENTQRYISNIKREYVSEYKNNDEKVEESIEGNVEENTIGYISQNEVVESNKENNTEIVSGSLQKPNITISNDGINIGDQDTMDVLAQLRKMKLDIQKEIEEKNKLEEEQRKLLEKQNENINNINDNEVAIDELQDNGNETEIQNFEDEKESEIQQNLETKIQDMHTKIEENKKKELDQDFKEIKSKVEELTENQQIVSADFNEMYAKIFGTVPVSNTTLDEKVKKIDEIESILLAPYEEKEYVQDRIENMPNNPYRMRPAYKFAGIAFNTYIMIEIEKELYILDQHAAHERIMYEKVKKNYYNQGVKDSQMLLLPDVISLSFKEMEIAKENMKMFEKAGFTLEEFGDNTLKLTGVPTICFDLDTKELFLEMLDEINTVARTARQEKEERFLATIACKAAVKGNMSLDLKEVEKLMDELLVLPNPFTCPHGRPTAIKMTKYDIERKFARK